MLQVCRTCLQQISTANFVSLIEDGVIRNKLDACIPEMSLPLTIDPVMCQSCLNALNLAFDFRNRCSKTEALIRRYVEFTNLNASGVNLVEVFNIISNMASDMEDSSKTATNVSSGIKTEQVDPSEITLSFTSKHTQSNYNIAEGTSNANCENVQETREVRKTYKTDITTAWIKLEEPSATPLHSCKNVSTQTEKQHYESNVREHDESQRAMSDLYAVYIKTEKKDTNAGTNEGRLDHSSDQVPLVHGRYKQLKRINLDHAYSSAWFEELSGEPSIISISDENEPSESSQVSECTERKRASEPLSSRGEVLFQCGECSYKCLHKCTLIKHMRIHSGNKPYKCNQCTYRCNVKSNLNRHRINRHGSRDVLHCRTCNFVCLFRRTLRAHMKGHKMHGAQKSKTEKPYKCPICNFQCTYKFAISCHIRKHSKDDSTTAK